MMKIFMMLIVLLGMTVMIMMVMMMIIAGFYIEIGLGVATRVSLHKIPQHSFSTESSPNWQFSKWDRAMSTPKSNGVLKEGGTSNPNPLR